jgi:predicted nucleic acid-binding protein
LALRERTREPRRLTTFIDTAIVIYLLDEKSDHHKWSVEELNKAKKEGPVIIPDIAYSELSVGLPSKEATDKAIAELALERFPCSDETLFRAGRAFKKYKEENTGPKLNVLSDFLIVRRPRQNSHPCSQTIKQISQDTSRI